MISLDEQLNSIKNSDKVFLSAYIYFRKTNSDLRIKDIMKKLGRKTGYSIDAMYRIIRRNK